MYINVYLQFLLTYHSISLQDASKSFRRQSVMKVCTLKESIDSCAKNDKKKRKSRGEMIKSFFGKIEEEDVMNRTSRGSILRSTSSTA